MTLNFDNKTIHYQSSGSGQTIVLLHGFLETLKIWDSFAKTLSNKFKVITIDLPGFGLSDNFSETHTMAFMADAVKSVLDHLKIDCCVMTGHSMGGYVSLAFAKKYPGMLNGFCLFNSQAAADSEEAKINRDRAIKLVKKNRSEFIHNFIPDLFAEKNKTQFRDEIEALILDALNMSEEAIVAALKGMKVRDDSLGLFRTFSKPVLFISGKQDKRIPLESIIKQAALPHHCEVLLLDSIGHMGFMEEGHQTLLALEGFTRTCFKI